jgi:PAS domain S-box-containing protein
MTAGLADAELVEALYGPALHDGDWRPALERTSQVMSCIEVSLATLEAGEVITFENLGRLLSEEARERYALHYRRLDPKLPLIAQGGEGFLFNDSAHFDETFIGRDPFYQEFSRWVGTRHTLDIAVAPDRERPVFFAAMRTSRQGRFQPTAEASFAKIARHFARAHALQVRLAAAEASLELARTALDTLAHGLVVLDGSGSVRLVNQAAERALGHGRLERRRGRLGIRTPNLDRALQGLIEGALSGERRHASALRVPRDGEPDWVIWVTPLPATSRLAPAGSPGALILIGSSGGDGRIEGPDLMALYGLTAAEAQLALALVAGRSLQQAAADRGVAFSTARSQLLAVMEKAGVHRQSDLIRLISNLPGAGVADG